MESFNHLFSKRRTFNKQDVSFPLNLHVLDIIVRSTEAARTTDISSAKIPDPIEKEEEEEVFVYIVGAQQDGSSVIPSL